MDSKKLISKKLLSTEKCVASLKGFYLDESSERCPGILSLVENIDGHCIFLYIAEKPNPASHNDLLLFKVLEVNLDFKYSSNATSSYLSFSNARLSFAFEVDLNNSTSEKISSFMVELERAEQIHSQNVVFTIPSFAWINKYLDPTLAIVEPALKPDDTSLIQFEDTTPVGTLDDTDGWPFDKIIQLNDGQPCPVVKDTTVHGELITDSQVNNNKKTNKILNTNSSNLPHGRSNSRSRIMEGSGGGSNTKRDVTMMKGSSREAIAALLMKQRETEYTRFQNYRVFCGTYNVNGQPPEGRLINWLSPENDKSNPPDIYAIGLQEIDPSKNLYVKGDSRREVEWLAEIERSLNPNARYKRLMNIRMVATMMVIYVRESLDKHISNVMADSAATGFLGTLGNKGGLAIRFQLRGTTLCFVSSHLYAYTEEWERRNQNYRDINAKVTFRDGERTFSISDHDIIFWFGDLNYRIDDIELEECKKLIINKQLQDLLNFDQLKRQMDLKKVFLDYKEGPLTFVPTYKYNVGTDAWDSEKQRTPAWCDRVLWRGDNVEQLIYRSHPEIKLSDHKPVSAVFLMGTKVFDKVAEKKVREEVMKLLDQKENEFLPQISLSTTDVVFQDLKYLDNQQKSIAIKNTGQVPVQFQFINKPTESNFCQPWLQIQPSEGYLPVGGMTQIILEVQINSKTVPHWDNYKIDDILILHLQGGKDFFITVSGNCIPSCFGMPLSKLVRIFGPVTYCSDQGMDSNLLRNKGAKDCLDIPKELWFLIDYLFKYGMEQEDLFQILGLESEIRKIRDCLDESVSGLGSEFMIHSVAETLLVFLDSLPEPVIPYDHYYTCLEAHWPELSTVAVKNLPTCHQNVFKYICRFLHEFISRSDKNKSDVRVLAHVFGAVLLKSPKSPDTVDSLGKCSEEINKKASFMERCILVDVDFPLPIAS